MKVLGIAVGMLVWSALAVGAQETQGTSETTEPAAATELLRMVICEDVAKREPVRESDSFTNSVGRLVCFTQVSTSEATPMELYHRWFVGEKLVNEIPIRVGGPMWRCWSRKSIQPNWTGPCRVEILTEEGELLGVREFTLQDGVVVESQG